MAAQDPAIAFSDLISSTVRGLYSAGNLVAYTRFPGGARRFELEGPHPIRDMHQQALWLLRLYGVRLLSSVTSGGA